MFPNAKIIQHYGLTEASRSTFLHISDVPDGLLESVGMPVGKTDVEITEKNCIKIRGPHVARWRIDADGLHELLDSQGWFVTNDLGHMEDGYLYFDGRADDMINCGGVKIYPDLLESRIRVLLGQDSQIAVAKVPDILRGDGILVVIESGSNKIAQIRKVAISALKEIGVDAGASLHVKEIESIPRTTTGKIQRRLITEEFSQKKTKAIKDPAQNISNAESKDVHGFFESMFPGKTISLKDNFEILGGDSLSYIRFSLNFERKFGSLPDKWEEWNVKRLQQHVNSSEKSIWRRLEASTLTRAIGMILIVALHFETFIYSHNWGAAYFLFMLAGYSVTRFQLPEINRTGSVKVLFGTITRIAIPTITVLALLQLKHTTFELKPLLLISNYFDPFQYKVMYFYFVEIYIQLLLLAALLFSISSVRELFQKRPMLSAIILLVFVSGLDKTIGLFWNTDHLFDRPVHNWMWCFACGVVMASATDMYKRLLAMTVIVIATWIYWDLTSAMFWVSSACAILLFVREIWVMAPVKTIIAEIAGASIFIYLSHYHLIPIARRIFGENSAWPGFFFALAFGIAVTHIYDWGDGKVRTMIRARKK